MNCAPWWFWLGVLILSAMAVFSITSVVLLTARAILETKERRGEQAYEALKQFKREWEQR